MEIHAIGSLAPPQVMAPVDSRQNMHTLCPPESTLWMGDMNPDWNLEFICEAFGKFGINVKNVKFVTEKNSGKAASYCFVEFENEDDARHAILTTNGRHVPNCSERRRFHLSFANSPDPHLEFNLFVHNLHHSVDDVALFKVFGEKYKSCRGAKVYRNPDGSSKEGGFIRFMSETDQQMALVEMNKVKIKGKELILKLASKDRMSTSRRGSRGGFRGGRHGPDSFNPMVNQYGMGGPYSRAPQYPTNPYNNFMPPSTGFPAIGRDSRSTRGRRNKRSRSRSISPQKEPVIHFEPVEPPSKYVHNDFLLESDWDLQTAFDSARFSKILIPPALKLRDLGVQLYETK